MVAVKHHDQLEWAGKLGHWWLQAAEAGCDVLASRHAVVRRLVAQVFLNGAWLSSDRRMIGGRLLVVRHFG